MHGAILHSFSRFVQDRHGAAGWDYVISGSRYRDQAVVPSSDYPDIDFTTLVDRVVQYGGEARDAVLESFGEQLVRPLLGLYSFFINPQWRTLDLIDNARPTIHRVLRMRNSAARPPRIMCCRLDASHALVVSADPQCHCAIMHGLLRGIAAHCGETVELQNPACLQRGAACCEILVRLVGPGAAWQGDAAATQAGGGIAANGAGGAPAQGTALAA